MRIKQGGQNIGFLLNDPGYRQCGYCKYLKKTCLIQNINPAIGLLKDGTCSGYKWSFIKWIKDKIDIAMIEYYLDKHGIKRKPSLHTKAFHIRNVMGNLFNAFLSNEYKYQYLDVYNFGVDEAEGNDKTEIKQINIKEFTGGTNESLRPVRININEVCESEQSDTLENQGDQHEPE